MCIARCMTVYRALAYIRSRITWTASSHPVPSNDAPRISLLSPSTRMRINPCVSPFSAARATRVIGRSPASPRRPLLRASAEAMPTRPNGRVGVKGIGGDTIADPARIVVEQIRGDDLEIVVRGVGEGALAAVVPESPNARRSGLQSVVDNNVATLVAAHSGFVEIEIVGIRSTADCQQQMRASDFRDA